MGEMTNHLYIDEPLTKFFNNSKILNATSLDGKREKRDLFVLLAAYGYYLNLRIPFQKPQSKGQDINAMHQLKDGSEKLAIIYAIAISETNDPKIILDDTSVAKIAMEYANGGLSHLKQMEETSQLDKKMLSFRIAIKEAHDSLYSGIE